MKFWAPDELRTFLTMIDGHRLRPIVRLAAMNGLRRGELCGLRWSDVDLAHGTATVRHAITVVGGKALLGDVKTERSRRVVDIDPGTGLVFTTPLGEGVHPDSLSQGFDRLVVPRRRMSDAERKGLPIRIRFHDLRHTHASQLLAAGVNVKVVSDRLGHASVAFTLDTYAHLMPGQQAQAVAAAAALVDGA